MSRAVLARDLDISLPSVVRIIDELIKEKFIRYTGEFEESGRRKRPLVEMNQDENITIGLDLGGTKAYACVVDLSGRTLAERNIPVHNTKNKESYKVVVSLIDEMLAFAVKQDKIIRGISVGVPGITTSGEGKVVYAPSLEWRNLPLQTMLEKKYGMPVVIENDVNMAALGEMWFGHGRNRSNVVLISIGTGLGAGLIVDGCIYRGANEAAGELGYIIFDEKELEREYPSFGPLEYSISGTGIAIQAKHLPGNENYEYTAKSVFEAYRNNEKWAINIIENFINKLAMTIIAACSVIDPQVIILSGGIMNSANEIMGELREKVNGKLSKDVSIEISDLKAKATVLGGAVSLIHKTADYCIIRTMW
jgi:glucokinase